MTPSRGGNRMETIETEASLGMVAVGPTRIPTRMPLISTPAADDARTAGHPHAPLRQTAVSPPQVNGAMGVVRERMRQVPYLPGRTASDATHRGSSGNSNDARRIIYPRLSSFGVHPIVRIELVRAHLPRRVGIAVLLLALLAPTAAPVAYAQSSTAAHGSRTPRSRALAILGTIVGGLVGFGFTYASGQRGSSRCGPIHCQVFVWAAGGGLLGYFIGRQYDKNFAMYYRGVPPLTPQSVDAQLNGRPTVLAVADSIVAVGGSDGVDIFRGTALTPIAHRARGLHGIDALALAPHNGSLVLGSQAGLYLFPPRRGPGRLIRAGEVGATAASADRVYFGVGNRLEIAPLAADSAQPWPGVAIGAPVRDAALDSARHLLWTITDRALIAFRVSDDSLARIGSIAITGGARRLAILGDRAAVALGEGGVQLYDI